MRSWRILEIAVFLCAFVAIGQMAEASTVSIYDVKINTTSLVGHTAGPFSILVVLTDGSGIGDANTTVELGSIDFAGGRGLGTPVLFGGGKGDLATGVTITDSSFLNFFSEEFVAGKTLRFRLAVTTTAESGNGIPDGLTLSIVDGSGTPLATLSSAADSFLQIEVQQSGDSVEVFGSDPSRPPFVGGAISIDAPMVEFNSRATKTAARTLLTKLLPTSHHGLDEEIRQAIRLVDESLADDLWEDDFHLTAEGESVFDEEERAIHELTEAERAPSSLLILFEDIEGTLAGVDHALAQTALDAARLSASEQDELIEAQKDISEGQKAASRGQFQRAIEHYREAWIDVNRANHHDSERNQGDKD